MRGTGKSPVPSCHTFSGTSNGFRYSRSLINLDYEDYH